MADDLVGGTLRLSRVSGKFDLATQAAISRWLEPHDFDCWLVHARFDPPGFDSDVLAFIPPLQAWTNADITTAIPLAQKLVAESEEVLGEPMPVVPLLEGERAGLEQFGELITANQARNEPLRQASLRLARLDVVEGRAPIDEHDGDEIASEFFFRFLESYLCFPAMEGKGPDGPLVLPPSFTVDLPTRGEAETALLCFSGPKELRRCFATEQETPYRFATGMEMMQMMAEMSDSATELLFDSGSPTANYFPAGLVRDLGFKTKRRKGRKWGGRAREFLADAPQVQSSNQVHRLTADWFRQLFPPGSELSDGTRVVKVDWSWPEGAGVGYSEDAPGRLRVLDFAKLRYELGTEAIGRLGELSHQLHGKTVGWQGAWLIIDRLEWPPKGRPQVIVRDPNGELVRLGLGAPPYDTLYTVPDAAVLLSCTQRVLQGALDDGWLPDIGGLLSGEIVDLLLANFPGEKGWRRYGAREVK